MTQYEKELVLEVLESRIIDTKLEIKICDDLIMLEKAKRFKNTLETNKQVYIYMLMQLERDFEKLKYLID